MVLPTDSADVRVRDAQADDHAFVLGLVPELVAFGPPPWRDRPQMIAVDHRVIGKALEGRSAGATVLIAVDRSGARLGFIHLSEEDDYYDGACGHVGDLIVTPEARGRGVGRALLAAGEQWARACGYRMLTLNVFLANDGALALYKQVGFQPETMRLVKDLR
jgi:GNAT superfamily N-acetyltransferase